MLLALLMACSPGPVAGSGSGGTTPQDTGTTVARLGVMLGFPLVERERFDTLVGVDHDPVEQAGDLIGRATCTDYVGRGFPHCYDQHDGSDYILSGGFSAMDAGSTPVVAAAEGVVVYAEDGHYDRCHGDLSKGDVSCDGHDIVANAVILEHRGTDGDTWRTLYWHLKQDSVAVVLDQAVLRGEQLGLVGSSGYSSLPHLHFELQQVVGDDSGSQDQVTVDPYAGPYSQDATGWCSQGDEDDLPGDCD